MSSDTLVLRISSESESSSPAVDTGSAPFLAEEAYPLILRGLLDTQLGQGDEQRICLSEDNIAAVARAASSALFGLENAVFSQFLVVPRVECAISVLLWRVRVNSTCAEGSSLDLPSVPVHVLASSLAGLLDNTKLYASSKAKQIPASGSRLVLDHALPTPTSARSSSYSSKGIVSPMTPPDSAAADVTPRVKFKPPPIITRTTPGRGVQSASAVNLTFATAALAEYQIEPLDYKPKFSLDDPPPSPKPESPTPKRSRSRPPSPSPRAPSPARKLKKTPSIKKKSKTKDKAKEKDVRPEVPSRPQSMWTPAGADAHYRNDSSVRTLTGRLHARTGTDESGRTPGTSISGISTPMESGTSTPALASELGTPAVSVSGTPLPEDAVSVRVDVEVEAPTPRESPVAATAPLPDESEIAQEPRTPTRSLSLRTPSPARTPSPSRQMRTPTRSMSLRTPSPGRSPSPGRPSSSLNMLHSPGSNLLKSPASSMYRVSGSVFGSPAAGSPALLRNGSPAPASLLRNSSPAPRNGSPAPASIMRNGSPAPASILRHASPAPGSTVRASSPSPASIARTNSARTRTLSTRSRTDSLRTRESIGARSRESVHFEDQVHPGADVGTGRSRESMLSDVRSVDADGMTIVAVSIAEATPVTPTPRRTGFKLSDEKSPTRDLGVSPGAMSIGASPGMLNGNTSFGTSPGIHLSPGAMSFSTVPSLSPFPESDSEAEFGFMNRDEEDLTVTARMRGSPVKRGGRSRSTSPVKRSGSKSPTKRNGSPVKRDGSVSPTKRTRSVSPIKRNDSFKRRTPPRNDSSPTRTGVALRALTSTPPRRSGTPQTLGTPTKQYPRSWTESPSRASYTIGVPMTQVSSRPRTTSTHSRTALSPARAKSPLADPIESGVSESEAESLAFPGSQSTLSLPGDVSLPEMPSPFSVPGELPSSSESPASRAGEVPGSTASRPVELPASTASRPVELPGSTSSRPVELPSSTSSRLVDLPNPASSLLNSTSSLATSTAARPVQPTTRRPLESHAIEFASSSESESPSPWLGPGVTSSPWPRQASGSDSSPWLGASELRGSLLMNGSLPTLDPRASVEIPKSVEVSGRTSEMSGRTSVEMSGRASADISGRSSVETSRPRGSMDHPRASSVDSHASALSTAARKTHPGLGWKAGEDLIVPFISSSALSRKDVIKLVGRSGTFDFPTNGRESSPTPASPPPYAGPVKLATVSEYVHPTPIFMVPGAVDPATVSDVARPKSLVRASTAPMPSTIPISSPTSSTASTNPSPLERPPHSRIASETSEESVVLNADGEAMVRTTEVGVGAGRARVQTGVGVGRRGVAVKSKVDSGLRKRVDSKPEEKAEARSRVDSARSRVDSAARPRVDSAARPRVDSAVRAKVDTGLRRKPVANGSPTTGSPASPTSRSGSTASVRRVPVRKLSSETMPRTRKSSATSMRKSSTSSLRSTPPTTVSSPSARKSTRTTSFSSGTSTPRSSTPRSSGALSPRSRVVSVNLGAGQKPGTPRTSTSSGRASIKSVKAPAKPSLPPPKPAVQSPPKITIPPPKTTPAPKPCPPRPQRSALRPGPRTSVLATSAPAILPTQAPPADDLTPTTTSPRTRAASFDARSITSIESQRPRRTTSVSSKPPPVTRASTTSAPSVQPIVEARSPNRASVPVVSTSSGIPFPAAPADGGLKVPEDPRTVKRSLSVSSAARKLVGRGRAPSPVPPTPAVDTTSIAASKSDVSSVEKSPAKGGRSLSRLAFSALLPKRANNGAAEAKAALAAAKAKEVAEAKAKAKAAAEEAKARAKAEAEEAKAARAAKVKEEKESKKGAKRFGSISKRGGA